MSLKSFRTVTSREMQELDRRAMQEFGIPRLLLMENAGRSVADWICQQLPQDRQAAALIFCGKGNNGGDGLVVARHLFNRGFKVHVLLFALPEQLKSDSEVNFQICHKMGIPHQIIQKEIDLNSIHQLFSFCDVIVDAMFGIGLNKDLGEPYLTAIEAINESGKKVIAIDIPSGLNADTGQVMGAAVQAKLTVTLGLSKKGLFEREGPLYSGRIEVADIGLPNRLTL